MQPVYLSFYPPSCLSVWKPVYPSTYPSIHLSVHLSLPLSILLASWLGMPNSNSPYMQVDDSSPDPVSGARLLGSPHNLGAVVIVCSELVPWRVLDPFHIPGKPIAHHLGRISFDFGLLWSVVGCSLRLLGFPDRCLRNGWLWYRDSLTAGIAWLIFQHSSHPSFAPNTMIIVIMALTYWTPNSYAVYRMMISGNMLNLKFLPIWFWGTSEVYETIAKLGIFWDHSICNHWGPHDNPSANKPHPLDRALLPAARGR